MMMISPGASHTIHYRVPPGRGVPDLYPDSPHFAAMPPVFATGFLVGLMEWCCIDHLAPELPEGCMSLGLGVDITHDAPCTEGAELDVECRCSAAGPKSVTWDVEVRCGDVVMGRGTHKRVIVDKSGFVAAVDEEAARRGWRPLRSGGPA